MEFRFHTHVLRQLPRHIGLETDQLPIPVSHGPGHELRHAYLQDASFQDRLDHAVGLDGPAGLVSEYGFCEQTEAGSQRGNPLFHAVRAPASMTALPGGPARENARCPTVGKRRSGKAAASGSAQHDTQVATGGDRPNLRAETGIGNDAASRRRELPERDHACDGGRPGDADRPPGHPGRHEPERSGRHGPPQRLAWGQAERPYRFPLASGNGLDPGPADLGEQGEGEQGEAQNTGEQAVRSGYSRDSAVGQVPPNRYRRIADALDPCPGETTGCPAGPGPGPRKPDRQRKGEGERGNGECCRKRLGERSPGECATRIGMEKPRRRLKRLIVSRGYCPPYQGERNCGHEREVPGHASPGPPGQGSARHRGRSVRGRESAAARRPGNGHGAGEGNRTLIFSLEGCGSTIELHPHGVGGGGWIRTSVGLPRRIYSPVQLSTLPPHRASALNRTPALVAPVPRISRHFEKGYRADVMYAFSPPSVNAPRLATARRSAA